MKVKKAIQRVDLQVALLVAVFVVISCFVIFYFAYTLSYKQMVVSLADRVHSIAMYVDKKISASIFKDINSPDDMQTPAYEEAHEFLSDVREASTAQYIYTATKNEKGVFIYHIDGLSYGDRHFRKPGDLIEEDFQDDLAKALTDTVVLPNDIKKTAWGDVFVAYYPIHGKDNKEVIGALGIEFPAKNEYKAFQYIRNMTPLVILVACILAFFTSRFLFRRISNPHFKDLSNTDALTCLKNRNAYELDMENLIQSERVENYAIVLADLNGLKAVNDKFGHKKGDEYIKNFANILIEHNKEDYVNYRIGGDEFAIFFFDPYESVVLDFIQVVKTSLQEKTEADMPFCSVAMGYAFCDKLTADSLEKTQAQADSKLYADKKAFYENNKSFNNRKQLKES